jgi:hypothetical protein
MAWQIPAGRRAVAFALLALFVACALPAVSRSAGPKRGEDPDSLEDKILKGVDDDLTKQDHQGEFTIALVGPDGKSFEASRFVRGTPGQWAVSEFPRVFSLEGKSLFTAGTKLEADVPAAGSVTVFCPADPDAGDATHYASHCTARIPPGKYSIAPFDLEFEVRGNVIAASPALSAQGKTLTIHATPVTFRAQAPGGVGLALSGFQLFHGQTNLLEHLVDSSAGPAFSSLTLYLPRGLEYRSTFGTFRIDEQGAVVATKLAEGVKLSGSTFTQETTAQALAPVEAVGKGYWMLSPNLRRVFRRGETARFEVIVAGEGAAATLPVVLVEGNARREIGKLDLPASPAGTDARLMLLDTGKLAPGKYEITLGHADARSFAFEIVDLQPTTPLFLFTVNSCGESDFTLDSAGLDQLRDTGVRCWTSYGHGSALGRLGDGAAWKSPYPSAPADAPAELRRPVTPPRVLLDDTLRHGLFTIDYENRRAGWYNEGLAFHHSHPMSVERMVRRVQIFGQELEDYPAFAGMSYTWFPSLGGYVEGGVCTDPFFGTRMDVLRKLVKEQTGFEPLTQAESEQLQKGSPAERRAPADKLRSYWRAEQRIGWYGAMSLYNQKLREVRKDFICTTSENAGHDSGKSLADMAAANDAMSFESYTDFGDWPMSAGFVADWAHAQSPGKPSWQAVESSQNEPSIVAKQFYKFARGTEGIANGVHGPRGARSNAKRALTNQFLERYGPLVTAWTPDTQVAVCVSEMQFGEYDAHALHSHLTRLGYGPVILFERTLESEGVPPTIKAVFVPNLRVPFSDKAEKSLHDFQARGGKVVLVGEKSLPLDGAVRVEIPLKTLFDVGGFPAHVPFFGEFKKVRPALEKATADIGLSPRNGADPERAVLLPSTSGGIRYVTVISSPLDSKDTEFNPITDVAVKVGTAKKIINLVTNTELAAKDGVVSVDLVKEPVAFLALLDAVPQSVVVHYPSAAVTGDTLAASAEVSPGAARAPVEYKIADGAGKVRATFYRLAGDAQGVTYRIPQTDPAGTWSLTVTELLTGLTAKAQVAVKAGPQIDAATPADAVFCPHPDRLPLFMGRKQEVRVVVEETQADALPDAQRIVAALQKAGRSASIEEVSSASYDMYWLRWVPTKLEENTLSKIDAGEVVGYRGNLQPYVNSAKRALVPEKGGWSDIDPPYVLRTDVVLFSGGRIADSLGVMSDWTATPNFPGRGQGTLEVSLSPFWADRDALSVISHDDAGRRKSVDRLMELIETGGKTNAGPAAPAAPIVVASSSATGADRAVLPAHLKDFVPPALAQAIAVAPDGGAIVQLKGGSAIVTPAGGVRVVPRFDIAPAALNGGVVFGAFSEITAFNPSWHFPSAWKVAIGQLDSAGHALRFDVPAEFTAAGDRFDGWDACFAPSPDGKSYFAGRDGGGFFLFDLPGHSVRVIDEPARELRYYEQVRVPVSIAAARFSPEGSVIAYTTGSHPSGYGALFNPPPNPHITSLRVVDAKTGKTIWVDHAEKMNDSSLCAVNNCLAVSEGGRRVALIDWEHTAAVFDGQGKQVFRKPIFDWHARYQSNNNPKPLRCEIARDGNTVLFASDGNVLLTDGAGAVLANITVPALDDARLAADASGFFTADQDGAVVAYDRAGKPRWNLQTRGERPKLGVSAAGLLIAEGAGNLLTADSTGKVIRTIPLADQKLEKIEVAPAPMAAAPLYREPQTLPLLQKLGAKNIARWQPAGAAQEYAGKKFYPVAEAIRLEAPGTGPRLIHLVYRHADKPTQVTLIGGEKPLTFTLDLPTPEYRVVDLPYDARQGITVTVAPSAGLQVAELSIHAFTFPGTNGLYVRPAGVAETEGLGVKKSAPGEADSDTLLDDKDSGAAAKAASGKMKNAAIFANNPDPDQVEGHYLRATGNALQAFDGLKFTDGKPGIWTNGGRAPIGTRLLVDLNHDARPLLCATYELSLTQSQVMQGIAILKGHKADFVLGTEGPDHLTREPRVVAGVFENDQFFNVFDLHGVQMDALGIYVISRDGKDLGLSEVELYE